MPSGLPFRSPFRALFGARVVHYTLKLLENNEKGRLEKLQKNLKMSKKVVDFFIVSYFSRKGIYEKGIYDVFVSFSCPGPVSSSEKIHRNPIIR